MTRVAFHGLGIMGGPMAGHVHAAGFELAVWNRTASRAHAFAAEHPGVRVGVTPADATRGAELVVTMVVDAAAVRETLLKAGTGAAATAADGALFVDCSTIGAAAAREIAAELDALGRGFKLIDAPVTGSTPGALAGTLTYMVGAGEAELERAGPLLQAMGEVVIHCGGVGEGQAVKVITNSVAAANATALGQALLLGSEVGVDREALAAAIRASASASRMADLKAAPMLAHDYTPLFRLDHMLKDVKLCLEEADRVGGSFAFADQAAEVLTQAAVMGHGDDDFAALIEALEQRAGRRL
jgi:3-hydroxyisobutyrate dehydrogenase-like beta-hydroxyacid dehydrogenase